MNFEKYFKEYKPFLLMIFTFLMLKFIFDGVKENFVEGRLTSEKEHGGGHIAYLDKHDVRCKDNETLSGFGLVSTSDNKKIKYKYLCEPVKKTGVSPDKFTTLNDWGGKNGDVAYLDRHAIDCGDNLLNRFQLRGNWDKKAMQYVYTCSNSGHFGCSDYNTDWKKKKMKGGHTFDLREHNFKCLPGMALKSVKFVNDGKKGRYDYTCCVPGTKEEYAEMKKTRGEKHLKIRRDKFEKKTNVIIENNKPYLKKTLTQFLSDEGIKPAGPKGLQGIQGLVGSAGPTGPKGLQGKTGSQGLKGIQGIQGVVGPAGPIGKGDKGLQGLKGIQGLVGPVGSKGLTGERGMKGMPGNKGDKGVKGGWF